MWSLESMNEGKRSTGHRNSRHTELARMSAKREWFCAALPPLIRLAVIFAHVDDATMVLSDLWQTLIARHPE
jgi:hypothetical protein